MYVNGIIKLNRKTGEREQYASDLPFGEALIQVAKLRLMNDGNFYWIGSLN